MELEVSAGYDSDYEMKWMWSGINCIIVHICVLYKPTISSQIYDKALGIGLYAGHATQPYINS